MRDEDHCHARNENDSGGLVHVRIGRMRRRRARICQSKCTDGHQRETSWNADAKELLSLWEGWHWDDNKGGWLDPELCAKARRDEVEHICRHKMYTRVPREACPRETGRAPIKTGWAETDKGQPGKPKVRARWVAKDCKTHARPEWYASTPPLEALKVVKYAFYAPSRRRVFVELPPEGNQAGDEHMCGLLQHSLHGTRDAAENGRKSLHQHSLISS